MDWSELDDLEAGLWTLDSGICTVHYALCTVHYALCTVRHALRGYFFKNGLDNVSGKLEMKSHKWKEMGKGSAEYIPRAGILPGRYSEKVFVTKGILTQAGSIFNSDVARKGSSRKILYQSFSDLCEKVIILKFKNIFLT